MQNAHEALVSVYLSGKYAVGCSTSRFPKVKTVTHTLIIMVDPTEGNGSCSAQHIKNLYQPCDLVLEIIGVIPEF